MQKQKISFAVHPLFWMFGIYFCFTSQLFLFILLSLAAVEHELAHAYAAAKLGYSLNRVVLMPYGAIVKGDIGSISLKEEIYVALAGPLASGLTALGFVALWWFFPETYAFTDTAFFACASLALVNLLPAMPLDGGRVFFCMLSHFLGRKRAWVGCRIISFALCALLFSAFIYSLFSAPNLTLLFFTLFLFAGCLQGDKYEYERMKFSLFADFERGMEERRIAVSESFTLKKVIPLLRRDKYLILDVFSVNERYLGGMRQEELCARLESEDHQTSVGALLRAQKEGKNTQEAAQKEGKNTQEE